MQPDGNRIGTTNGGSAKPHLLSGALVRPSFGNGLLMQIASALRLHPRHRHGAKNFSIEIAYGMSTGEVYSLQTTIRNAPRGEARGRSGQSAQSISGGDNRMKRFAS